ncbi:alpha/beta hydrolase [Peteryoungia ipomoeae]|uniref:Alpha/beta fold hydrolase n=1 Tax=Peteryoungia ipomoeae TaxID=1210932 RepID=A0A4S8P2Q5_9HYPH|nr:alpha/beta fold hydrolase [Peteryoungia ipomoeae]THV23032.1 alpha/beta fold hydrolase [Peteryoungia ipomoeae]
MRFSSSASRGKTPFLTVAATALVCLAVQGCAGRPGPETIASVTAADFKPQRVERILTVTTRDRAKPGENVFTTEKSIEPNYARFDVSIPPNHKPANIEWPKGKTVNPRTDFAVMAQDALGREALLRDIAANAAKGQKPGVFVHGYNYNFQEALYRLAQLKTDSNIGGTPILFSWPSFAAIPAYVADKEAATYSRDALAALLVDLTRAGRGEVDVFAHSMGGWLTVEALRQLKLEGRQDVLDRLRVVLAAPDIDEDVFVAQMRVIGRMKTPITVLVAPDDRALLVSRFLGAGTQRVGSLDVTNATVAEVAKQAGVTIIDISSLPPVDSTNHNRFVDAQVLAGALSRPAAAARLGDAGAFVFDAAAQTISSPFSLAATVLRGQ